MHPIVQNILDKPLGTRIAIWVGTLVALTLGFWFYLYSPHYAQVGELAGEIEQLRSKITTEQRLAMNLKKFREEVKALDVKLKFALQELPDEREIPELLSSISNLARDAGLEVSLFKTRPEGFRDFYAEVPVEITVDGSYHQVASFFDEVGQLSRIVNISDIEIREPRAKEEFVSIKVGCVATTFRYLDEQERAARTAKTTKSSKRGKRD